MHKIIFVFSGKRENIRVFIFLSVLFPRCSFGPLSHHLQQKGKMSDGISQSDIKGFSFLDGGGIALAAAALAAIYKLTSRHAMLGFQYREI